MFCSAAESVAAARGTTPPRRLLLGVLLLLLLPLLRCAAPHCAPRLWWLFSGGQGGERAA
jgi:hypothetical protein